MNSVGLNQPESSTLPEAVDQPESFTLPEAVDQPESFTLPEAVDQPESFTLPEAVDQPESFSEIDAKDLTKKESWKEWTGRQWTDNKWYWIGGAVVVVGTAVGLYFCYNELSYLKFTRDLNKYQNLQNAYNKSMDCVLNKEVFRNTFQCPFREGITEMRLFWNGADKRGKLVAQKGFEHIWHQVQKDNPNACTNSFLKVVIIGTGGILPNSKRLSDDFT